MNVAGPSIKADSLWSAGITGAGSRIAIVEDSRIDFDNSCLPHNLGTRVPDHPEVDDHATATAGMAASTSSRFRGIAPGAGIYSSNATTYVPLQRLQRVHRCRLEFVSDGFKPDKQRSLDSTPATFRFCKASHNIGAKVLQFKMQR